MDLSGSIFSLIYSKMENIIKYEEYIAEKKGPCWSGYKQIGMKTKRGKKVPNCVKEDKSNG